MQDILKPLDLDTSQEKARSRRSITADDAPTQRPQIQKELQLKRVLSLFRRFPWKLYMLYFPILLIGVIGYAITAFILMTIEPRSIQHVLLTNSYAPLMISSGLAHFAVFSYLLLSTRRGAIMSATLSALLFLRLQQVLDQELAMQVVVLGVGVEVAATILTLLFNILYPKLQVLHSKVPRWQGRKSQDVDAASSIPDPSEPHVSKTSPRKRGRKRKHHFFGK